MFGASVSADTVAADARAVTGERDPERLLAAVADTSALGAFGHSNTPVSRSPSPASGWKVKGAAAKPQFAVPLFAPRHWTGSDVHRPPEGMTIVVWTAVRWSWSSDRR